MWEEYVERRSRGIFSLYVNRLTKFPIKHLNGDQIINRLARRRFGMRVIAYGVAACAMLSFFIPFVILFTMKLGRVQLLATVIVPVVIFSLLVPFITNMTVKDTFIGSAT